MHSQDIRHQDIKPSNVIYRGSDIFFTAFSSSSRFEIDPTTSTENPARTSAMYGLRSLFKISLMASTEDTAVEVTFFLWVMYLSKCLSSSTDEPFPTFAPSASPGKKPLHMASAH